MCVTRHVFHYYMQSTEKGNVIPHISATSSELSPQSSSPSQTQKCSLQRELLHKNSSALHIFPPGRMKRRQEIKMGKQKDERTSILDKTSTTTYHILSTANGTRTITKWTNPKWKGWKGREKHSFKNLFLHHTLPSLYFHEPGITYTA